MYKLIYVFGLLLSVNCLGNEKVIEANYVINGSRSALNIDLTNTSNQDVYCQGMDVEIMLVDDEFGSYLGGFSLVDGPFYFKGDQKTRLEDVGLQRVESYRSEDSVAVISTAKAIVFGCRHVTFADYCEFAEKTEAEQFTLEKLMTAARTENCGDVEANLGSELDLSEQGVSSLKPISYLKSLKKLVLNKNNIADINDLKNLHQLTFLDSSDNPVTNIDAAVGLPNILKIKANNTRLEYKKFPKISRTLTKLEVRGTPYEAQLKNRKK